MSRCRDPQLQVTENYYDLQKEVLIYQFYIFNTFCTAKLKICYTMSCVTKTT